MLKLAPFGNIFKIPDLKRRFLFTVALIAVYRIGCYIPTPGIDGAALSEFFQKLGESSGPTLFGIMNMFTGGALTRATVFALGIMPYISASIILQLLVAVIPALEKLSAQGEEGRQKLNQYTRYLTLAICLLQGYMIALWLSNPHHFQVGGMQYRIVLSPGIGFNLMTMITLTTGTLLIMWLGEQIQERGIGNGISLIITAGIVSRMPVVANQTITWLQPFTPQKFITLGFVAAILVVVLLVVILITQGQRRIPIQYARRVVGRRIYGGQSTYLPLRVNQAGVIPIIFAQSVILFPATIATFLPRAGLIKFSQALQKGGLWYSLVFAGFIMFFTYFYTAITFNPLEISKNLKKYGGFIPGIRPGTLTAQYLDFIMTRIALPGAIFLASIAVFPDILINLMKVPSALANFFGGTSVLIVVGVMLDTMRQLESRLMMRHYEGFMKKGTLKGRR